MLNNQIRELIPIEVQNGQQAVNARHLYEWLKIKKYFTDWMTAQIKRCDLIEDVDYQAIHQQVECSNGIGYTTRIEYALSLNAAKEISMMSQTEKGKEARRYFIECERVAMSQQPALALPQDYKHALMQLLAQVEANEKLQQENKALQDDIVTKDNINSMLMGENDTMRPKARIYDQVMQSPDLDTLRTTSSVANEIGMSGQKLNKMLIACGIIYKQADGDYLFTSEYIGWELGKLVSTVVNDQGLVKTYIKWNTRGRAYIHALHETNWDKRRAWHLLRTGENKSLTKNN